MVSTCIGEEGIDIGEVDLSVCYDIQQSPTRMVQRMGRTGRKRRGRGGKFYFGICSLFAEVLLSVILLSEGGEDKTYLRSLAIEKKIWEQMAKKDTIFSFFNSNQNMV